MSSRLDESPIPGRGRRDFVVCKAEELPPGTMKLVPVGKFGVGVYNVNGTLSAVNNYCPHQGAPVCLGKVRGTTVYDSDQPGHKGYQYVLDGQVLRCPWHLWEFDMLSGRTLVKPERRVKTYPVRVENGQVILTR